MSPAEFHTGQVILVTGAARGIGRAIADLLVDRGAIVVRGDLQKKEYWEPSKADANGARLSLDVTSTESCQNAIENTLSRFSRVDGLVNNAGVVTRGPAEMVNEKEFDRVLDVNLKGALRMSQAVFPTMSKHGGTIVNMGSTNGHVAVANTLGYCLSKAAVIHMAKVMALEWARYGIRVNAVSPTIVPTDMTADVRDNPDYMAAKLRSIPLGRMASAEDVAEAVSYLMGPGSLMITGQNIFVDGGATLG